MKYVYLNYNGKRPNNSRDELAKELVNYVKEETKKNHFPSRREIEGAFHLKLDSIFSGIDNLYSSAGLTYKLSPNQDTKTAKANLLQEIILKNLNKFGLTLVDYRKVTQRGIDILAENKGERVGIEIKAYNSGERIKSKDINQVLRFISSENLARAIIITTTNLKAHDLASHKTIDIIYHDQLASILEHKHLKKLEYICRYSVNTTNILKNIKRQKILDYVSETYASLGNKPTYNDILRNLNLDLYTYFNSLFDIYKTLRIPPPLKHMRGKRAKIPDREAKELWKQEFKKYILDEIKKGKKYPSGEEIGKHFSISHIWNIVNVSELYKELGLHPYRERAKRNST